MLRLTWFTLLCVSACTRGAVVASEKPFYSEETHAQHFEEFKVTYNKQYSTTEEEQQRFEVFKSNLNHINELNAKHKETVFGINQFADMTSEEVMAKYTGLVIDGTRQPIPPPPMNFSTVAPPESFDWRDKNVVTRVKDQRLCGSCWAFGAVGSLESNYAIKYGKLQEFSEQQLVDCDHSDGGCLGGLATTACQYIMANGEMSEDAYPYTGSGNSRCQYDSSKGLTKAKACNDYTGSTEDDLKKILYTKGPLAIGVDATNFQHYQNGVYRECACKKINHAVLLVGYGTENGVDFWTIKNSWTPIFGENGYIRIQRGINCCGLVRNDGNIVHVEV